MIRLKVYNQGREVLVAACDADLLGQTLREGELRLEVKPDFYDGIVADREQLLRHLRLATIGNFVGEETVAAALDGGFIEEAGIIRIDGVPHAQMVVL
ncbi:MAG: DUF424 family protein [Thermoplasmata archaeon]|nr:DUF424 family protein [Thermoplasmata archaeon]